MFYWNNKISIMIVAIFAHVVYALPQVIYSAVSVLIFFFKAIGFMKEDIMMTVESIISSLFPSRFR